MTAHTPDDSHTTEQTPDPIGPVELPRRTRLGARAVALVGSASMATLAVHVIVNGYSTETSIITQPN